MIFVTDPAGRAVFVGPEWEALTGQTLADAVNFGWVDVVHPDDRDSTRSVVEEAIRRRAEFSVRYRLLRRDRSYLWVAAGGVPSVTADKIFLGFLGSISEIARDTSEELRAYGSVGQFTPPPPHPSTLPRSALELIADHLLIVHALAAEGVAEAALPSLKSALFHVGRELALQSTARDATSRFQ